ncbi:hypothetical protein Sango_0825700 [Sesamum angolense]|uniref:Uncharacterized protein n=1 Tax=Sesamum angolense TaxID=2727404 RepID=A0AAE2C0K2_9LAMI|nr:hypothetical protein Sango_0825700 [Sesamum angolense]
MSNYDGIGSHSQTQSNSSPNAQTVNMDNLQNQVSGDHLENVEHYFDDNIDKELEGEDEDEDEDEDEEEDILGGRYVHMRCMAHIVNLIVQDGLKGKDEHEAISRIRGAIKYIRNSPARWNSTYLMLETAISLKIAFDAYEDVDLTYKTDLSRQPFDGISIDYDWERAKVLVKFLRHFYNLTLRISGALYHGDWRSETILVFLFGQLKICGHEFSWEIVESLWIITNVDFDTGYVKIEVPEPDSRVPKPDGYPISQVSDLLGFGFRFIFSLPDMSGTRPE